MAKKDKTWIVYPDTAFDQRAVLVEALTAEAAAERAWDAGLLTNSSKAPGPSTVVVVEFPESMRVFTRTHKANEITEEWLAGLEA